MATALLAHWLPALAQFDAQGLSPFLVRYATLDALAGRTVILRDDNGQRDGQALGLAADGTLRVRIEGVERNVVAGEVSVRTS